MKIQKDRPRGCKERRRRGCTDPKTEQGVGGEDDGRSRVFRGGVRAFREKESQ